jgi:hypothetical protein
MGNYTEELKERKQAKLSYKKMKMDRPCLTYGKQQDLYNIIDVATCRKTTGFVQHHWRGNLKENNRICTISLTWQLEVKQQDLYKIIDVATWRNNRICTSLTFLQPNGNHGHVRTFTQRNYQPPRDLYTR